MYCCDVHCAEYFTKKIYKRNFCNNCYDNYIETCKLIQGEIRKKQIKNLLNPKNILEKIYLSDDKKIIKYILKYGTNDSPKNGQIINIHYIGKLLNNTIFDTSNKNTSYEFILNKDNFLWNIIIKSMKKGEKCIIINHSEYNLNKYENISNNSTLYFEFELLDFRNNINNNLELIIDYKNKAIIEYNNNNLDKAAKFFNNALEYCTSENNIEKINILNNLSLIYIKLNNLIESLNYSKQAYNLSKTNIKVLYRLALNYYKLNKYDKCINICKQATKIEDNNMINSLYRNSIKNINEKKENDKLRIIYNKMF